MRAVKRDLKHVPEALRPIDPNGALTRVDTEIVRISRDLKILRYINPVNSLDQRERFFASHYRHVPRFRYVPLAFDPARTHRRLDALAVGRIRHAELRRIYRRKREELRRILALVASVGKPGFTRHSIELFGPRVDDPEFESFLADARHFSQLQPDIEAAVLTPQQARGILEREVAFYARQAPFRCQIKVREHLSANAAAGEQSVVIRDNHLYTQNEIYAVAAHEVTIHVLTAQNGFSQPLKILGVGLPGYLQDQEGYAIFSEYMGQYLTPNRLRTVGGRTLAVLWMMEGLSFSEVFARLVEEFRFDLSEAFSIAERAFRGGGYTKDAIYLQGFLRVYKSWIGGMDLSIFSAGKMAVRHVPWVAKLMREGVLLSPRVLPRFMVAESLEARRAVLSLFTRQDVRDFYHRHSNQKP